MALDFPSSPTNGQTFVSGNRTWTYNTTTSSWEASSVATSKTANYVYASPNGSAGIPDFRALVAADIPTLNQNTTGTAATITGVYSGTITSGQITTGLGFTPYNATNPSGYTSNLGTVTGVTGTAPIVSSGGTAPAISISAATTSAAGSMSAADKTKLDGIATSANNYVLPKATASALGGVEVFDAAVQTVAANAVTSTASRTYGVQLNAADQMVVNVPWVDTTNTGTVTSVATGTGLTGGPVTSTGTISLANTTVTAGSYTNSNITVDAQGRITAASNGAGTPTFDGLTAKTGGTGTYQTSGDFRAPIFYDSNNTGFYVDPNSTSVLNSLKVTSIYNEVTSSSSLTSGTWYTIAINGGDRAHGKFTIVDRTSGFHQSVTFYASHHFGVDGSNSITVLNNSFYGGAPITHIRILDGSTYEGAALQILVGASITSIDVYLNDDYQSGGWALVNFVANSSNPGITNWASLSERTRSYLSGSRQGITSSYYGFGMGYDTQTLLTDAGDTSLRVTTAYGYADIGPKNSNYNHIYTNISGGHYFDKLAINAASFRAPIFYDTDNTADYLDPNGTSQLTTVEVSGGSGFRSFAGSASSISSQIYFGNADNTRAWNWQVDENNRAALWGYNGSSWAKSLTVAYSGGGVFLRNSSGIDILAFSTSNFGYSSAYRTLILGDQANTTVCIGVDPVANPSGSFGGLGSGTEVMFKNGAYFISPNSANTAYNQYLRLIDGYAQFTNSARAPIFYDTNDTTYYVDPNSTSVMNAIQPWGEVGMRRGDSGTLLRSYNTSASQATQFYVNHNLGEVEIGNARGIVYAGGTYWQVANSTRSPIFYDSNDTTYYIDPNSTSQIVKLRVISAGNQAGGNIKIGQTGEGAAKWSYITAAHYNDTSESEGISLIGAYASSTANQIVIGGSIYEANPATEILFYTHTATTHGTGGSLRLSIGNDGAVVAQVDMRAPIFYDSNNTAYYVNPNGSSYLYSLSLSGSAYFQPNSWIQFNGSYGLYWPNTNDAHIHGNDLSSYGSVAIRGSRGGWRGIHFYEGGNTPHLMFTGANGGFYFETGGRWAAYYNYADNCWGFGTTSTSSAYNIYCPTGMYSGGRVDGTIFYDTNDTGYYANPNSVSNFADLRAPNVVHYPGWPGYPGVAANDYGFNAISSFTYANNAPYTGPFVAFAAGGYNLQLNAPYSGNGYGLAFRTRNGDTSAFNSWQYPAVYGVNVNGGGALYASIYYDQNDTGYYTDPNGTSVLYNTQLINLRCKFDRSWENYPGIAVYNTTDQGPQGDFRIHGLGGANGGDFNVRLLVDGTIQSLQDARAPIFYDTDNTGFYINPNGDTNLNRTFTYLGGKDTNANWNTGFQNTPAASYNYHGDLNGGTNAPAAGWWTYESRRHSNATNYWGTQVAWGWEDNANRLFQRNVTGGSFGGWVEYLNTSDRTYNGNLYMTGSIRSTSSDMRAPIFYDQDNTGYYTNPAGTSYINALNIGPTAAGSSYLNINGYNAYGGTGYHGFLTVSNTYGSATNPNQYWRINGAGGFEIVNSPYNAVLFTFTQGGDFTAAGNVTAYSDRKLKANFEPIENALSKVIQLNGVTFTRIDKEDISKRYGGLIAQDVEAVLPEAVQINETISYGEVKSVDYNATIALLVEAIKEQQSHITKLEEKLNKLLGE